MSSLDEVITCIMLHLKPEFLTNPIISKTQGSQKKQMERYNIALVAIKHALAKLTRYPVIFEKLYPCDKTEIKDAEALEHHIHAYLEDLDRLKNKIENIIGMLKNDLKQIASNKDEIEKAMNFLCGQVSNAFKNVSMNRHPHHHKGMKFLDGNLVEVAFADMALDDKYPMKAMLNEAGVEKMRKMQTEKFETAKIGWIANATKNSSELSGLTEAVMGSVKDFIYQLLEIPSYEELSKKLQQSSPQIASDARAPSTGE